MHTFIVPHCKSVNASSLIVYILVSGGTPVELPVVITGLCMTQREPCKGVQVELLGYLKGQRMKITR